MSGISSTSPSRPPTSRPQRPPPHAVQHGHGPGGTRQQHAPSISGTAAQGQTLTVTSAGTWSNSPSFQLRVAGLPRRHCSASPTSTNSTSYTVTAADVAGGYRIRVEVTGIQRRRIRRGRLADDRRGDRRAREHRGSHDHGHGGGRNVDRGARHLDEQPHQLHLPVAVVHGLVGLHVHRDQRRDGPDVCRPGGQRRARLRGPGDGIEHQRSGSRRDLRGAHPASTGEHRPSGVHRDDRGGSGPDGIHRHVEQRPDGVRLPMAALLRLSAGVQPPSPAPPPRRTR